MTFVTWKWPPRHGYRSAFGPETVNTLRAMVKRHYSAPHRFICVTNDSTGIEPSVEVLPDWKDFISVPSPAGGRHPSCYRRLRMFHPDIGASFGPRFVSMDLDLVITADLRPLLDRPEDFVIYGDTNPRTFYNGSLTLMTAGARPKVWTTFDPRVSPMLAKAAGHHGSDQGWISHCLGPKEVKFTPGDGVYSFRNNIQPVGGLLPANARVVVFHGADDPWGHRAQQIPWVREHYRKDVEVAA